MLALTLALAFAATTAQAQERATDTGRTLQMVDALRARGDYDAAAIELRGWLERWLTVNWDSPTFLDELERMQDLMQKMVEMEALVQAADDDAGAARKLLSLIIDPAQPTPRTREQAMALRLLARHDPDVKELLNAAFPAHLGRIEVDSPLLDENVLSFPLENALAEVSSHALPILRGAGASELRVHLTMLENDKHNSLLEGTAMRSYAMHMSAEIVGADGESIVRAATTTAVLGINPGNGAKYGMTKCAQLIYQQLVDELAKRAATTP